MTTSEARGGGARRSGVRSWDKPLLSVNEAAILLGERREVIYASIRRGDFPLRVFTINGRLRIARRSVDRLIDGRLASEHDDTRTLPEAPADHPGVGRRTRQHADRARRLSPCNGGPYGLSTNRAEPASEPLV